MFFWAGVVRCDIVRIFYVHCDVFLLVSDSGELLCML